MSFISGLKLRLVKGSSLTATEGDANLTKIDQAISDLDQSAQVFPSPDNVTVQTAGGVIKVKDGGIGATQLAANSVGNVAMADDAITPVEEKTAATAVTSSSGAASIDWSLGWAFYITLTENTTFSFANTKEGQTITIAVVQNASAAKTVTWPSVKWAGAIAPTMTATLSRTDVYTFTKINGIFYGAAVQNCG